MKHPNVDEFLERAERWGDELTELRRIALECGLTEEWKWRTPCYAFEKHNVAVIGELKECCVFSFFKGALLKDPYGILEKPGKNTESGRTIRFASVREIARQEKVLKEYIAEAIQLEKEGRKVEYTPVSEIPYPDELIEILEKDAKLMEAFEALTPGRRKGYLLYFSDPKQSKTRVSRIEKHRERILKGKGMHDR